MFLLMYLYNLFLGTREEKVQKSILPMDSGDWKEYIRITLAYLCRCCIPPSMRPDYEGLGENEGEGEDDDNNDDEGGASSDESVRVNLISFRISI